MKLRGLMAQPSPGRLGVHILGPGYGESIVLELPDGTIGIIDTFLVGFGKRTRCPVLDFVRGALPGRPLTFLAITHPHADHCMGVARIVRNLKSPQCLLVFHAYQSVELQSYFHRLVEAGLPAIDDDEFRVDTLTIAEELLNIEELAAGHKGTICLRAPRKVEVGEPKVRLSFLTPGDGAQRKYLRVLSRNLKGVIEAGPNLNQSWKRTLPNHNLASGAILLTYDKTRLLFLADAIGPLWKEWETMAAECCDPEMAPIQLVKVSHHGSLNGYHEGLFNKLCDRGTTIAVVTPFDRHVHPLPTRAGLLKILRHVKEILCTNREAAAASTRAPWAPLPDDEADLGSLLYHLERSAQARRQFNALAGRGDASAEDFRDLIQAFAQERVDIPASGRRPPVGQLAGSLEDDYRTSFYFNDRGEEIDRWIGRGVGRFYHSSP